MFSPFRKPVTTPCLHLFARLRWRMWATACWSWEMQLISRLLAWLLKWEADKHEWPSSTERTPHLEHETILDLRYPSIPLFWESWGGEQGTAYCNFQLLILIWEVYVIGWIGVDLGKANGQSLSIMVCDGKATLSILEWRYSSFALHIQVANGWFILIYIYILIYYVWGSPLHSRGGHALLHFGACRPRQPNSKSANCIWSILKHWNLAWNRLLYKCVGLTCQCSLRIVPLRSLQKRRKLQNQPAWFIVSMNFSHSLRPLIHFIVVGVVLPLF